MQMRKSVRWFRKGAPVRNPHLEAQRTFEIGSVWSLRLRAPVCVCTGDADLNSESSG